MELASRVSEKFAALSLGSRNKGRQLAPQAFADSIANLEEVEAEAKKPLTEALAELKEAVDAYAPDRAALLKDLEDFRRRRAGAL